MPLRWSLALATDELKAPKQAVTAAELSLAETLVKALEKPFTPDKYKDDYRDALKKVVDAKLKGVELKETKIPKSLESVDLMKALRESLDTVRKREKVAV